MTSEKALEIRRQLFHLILGSVIAAVVWILKPAYGNLIVLPLLAAIILLLAIPRIAPDLTVSSHLLTHFERKKDINSFPYKGAVYYGIGIIFPIILLPVELACVVILILSAGDSLSTIIGKFYGRHRIGLKSVEGTLAFIISSLAACMIFLWLAGRTDLAPAAAGLTLAGSLIELQPFLDDNMAIPMLLAILARLAGL
jgi:dolichol kinase